MNPLGPILDGLPGIGSDAEPRSGEAEAGKGDQFAQVAASLDVEGVVPKLTTSVVEGVSAQPADWAPDEAAFAPVTFVEAETAEPKLKEVPQAPVPVRVRGVPQAAELQLKTGSVASTAAAASDVKLSGAVPPAPEQVIATPPTGELLVPERPAADRASPKARDATVTTHYRAPPVAVVEETAASSPRQTPLEGPLFNGPERQKAHGPRPILPLPKDAPPDAAPRPASARSLSAGVSSASTVLPPAPAAAVPPVPATLPNPSPTPVSPPRFPTGTLSGSPLEAQTVTDLLPRSPISKGEATDIPAPTGPRMVTHPQATPLQSQSAPVGRHEVVVQANEPATRDMARIATDSPTLSKPAAQPLPPATVVAAPVMQPREVRPDVMHVDPGSPGAEALLGETRTTDAAPRPGVVQNASLPELPRPTVLQIVEAVRAGGSTIDVKLSPEELGRITLSLGTQDGLLNVVVQAERPETADLIRRSLDLLLAEAKDAGFEDIAFAFADSGNGGADGDHEGETEGSSETPRATSRPEAPAVTAARNTTGLDLRL